MANPASRPGEIRPCRAIFRAANGAAKPRHLLLIFETADFASKLVSSSSPLRNPWTRGGDPSQQEKRHE